MRYTVWLFAFCFCLGCSSRKYYTYVEHLDSWEEGEAFIDSLKVDEVDTIVGYYDGCSGCISGLDKTYYVFWLSSNRWYLKRFGLYASYKRLSGYQAPIRYLLEHADSIEYAALKKVYIELGHFGYDVVRIKLLEREMNYTIKDYEKSGNESAEKVILIDKIRSELLNVGQGEWKGFNYKMKRLKRGEQDSI